MATRGQRKRRTKRRQDHARGVHDRPHVGHQTYVEEGDVDGPPNLEVPLEDAVEFAKADKADSRRIRVLRGLEKVALALEVIGLAVWVVAGVLLNYGRTSALIGAAVSLLGCVLFWACLLLNHWSRALLRHDFWFTAGVVLVSTSPTVGLALGAWRVWWIGLVTGACMIITGFVYVIFMAKE